MISKAKVKYIRSFERKKGRMEAGAFVAEGPKVVGDLLQVMPAQLVIATEEWLNRHSPNAEEIIPVTDDELRKVSFLQHPQEVLAVFRFRDNDRGESVYQSVNDDRQIAEGFADSPLLFLALDGIQDPGNLGTIIRIADWFGIEHVVCSLSTVDVFNPKVVQATMGSIAHVHIYYRDLAEWLDTLPQDFPVYGTFLDGEDIYGQPLTPHGVIVMGNEGNGITPDIATKVNRRLLIPRFGGVGKTSAESLNVSIATAITCAEFRRRTM